MVGANFFYKFFKYKPNTSSSIVRLISDKNPDLQDKIKIKIIEIDEKISENSKALFEAQLVRFRSKFSKSNNFLEQIGRNLYKEKLNESIDWHQKQIKDLYIQRRELEINLEKITGVFWLNRIKRLLKIILIVCFMLLSLFIFLSSFMIIIYLMPLIILIFLVYLLATKKY